MEENKLQYNKGIYIAGKLNADAVGYLNNVHKMMVTAQEIKDAGYSVLVPCIDLLMGIKFGYDSYDDYFNNNLLWVSKSDGVFLVPGWFSSPGTRKEIEHAWATNVPVFDQKDEMWEYFQGMRGGMIVGFHYDTDGKIIGTLKYKEAEPEKYAIEMEILSNKKRK